MRSALVHPNFALNFPGRFSYHAEQSGIEVAIVRLVATSARNAKAAIGSKAKAKADMTHRGFGKSTSGGGTRNGLILDTADQHAVKRSHKIRTD